MLQLLRETFGPKPKPISDEQWLSAQFEAGRVFKRRGITIPQMPPDDEQIGFTALTGLQNMKQAFGFYKYALDATDLAKLRNPTILDFGGGWGRVARLFLRETRPENIIIAETRQSTIDLLKRINAPFTVIHNKPEPPLKKLPRLDLAIAYSVFSHLSEPYFLEWTRYLLNMLKPGGHIIITSRGHYFIEHLKRLHAMTDVPNPGLAEHIRRLKQLMPAPDEISARFESGQFQFYPIGGAGELTPSFFGEAFIPESYFRAVFPNEFVSYVENVPHVDQSVIVLRKT